jgi:hypothetical protein
MKLTKRQTGAAEEKALLYGVEFNGLQEMPGNKAAKYTWTDIVTGGTFLTGTLKELPGKVRSVRKKFANPLRAKKGRAVKAAARLSERFYGKRARFSSSINLIWPEAVTALGHCARLDYLSDKFDGIPRIYYHDFEEFPIVYANPEPQPGGNTMLIIVGKFKLEPDGITG